MYNFFTASTIYVNQAQGHNNYNGYAPYNDGKGSGPLKDINAAMEKVNDLRMMGAKQPVDIAIVGDYYTSSTISFSNGRARCLDGLTVRSYGNSRARIIGGRRLTGWKKDVFNGVSCISCVDEGLKDGDKYTDLYIDGKKCSFTRYPQGERLLEAVETAKTPGGLGDGSDWFIAHKEDLDGIEGLEDGIISFYHYWIDEHSPIKSYDRQTGKLVMEYRSRFQITSVYENGGASSDLRYYIENLPQSFNAPGEWYLDRGTKTVYYIPLEGQTEDNIEAFAPDVDKIITIRGSQEYPIQNVRLKNLDIMVSRGDYSSNGLASDEQSVNKAHAAVEIENASYCSVEDCKVTMVGVHGIAVLKNTHDIRIENSELTQLGAGGVKIFGVGYSEDEAEQKKYTHNITVRGCKISHGGKRYAAGCGILANFVNSCEFSDNEICHFDYTGISCGWDWGYHEANTNQNIIKGNHIHHIGMGKLSDMGGIYLLGKQKGTVVANNHIHDITPAHYGGWGIYTDEGSSYITVENNVVYRAKSNCYHQHYGSCNVVRNNIFAFAGDAVLNVTRDENHFGILFTGNLLVTDGETVFPEATPRRLANPSILSEGNFVWDISGKAPYFTKLDGKYYSLEEWQSITGLDGYTVAIDPLLDVENDKYELAENSPLWAMGFERIKNIKK